MTLKITIPQLKEKLDQQPGHEILEEAEKPPILQKVAQIEKLLADTPLPIATLKSACRTVMLALKENPDSLLELEPKDKSQIVQAYLTISDEESKAILTKQAKRKTTKKKVSNKAKEILKMAKEAPAADTDLDFL